MSGIPYPGFIGPAYTSQSPIASCAELWNWYLEIMEAPGTKSRAVFYPTPGFREFGRVAQIGGKGGFSVSSTMGRTFFVIGQRLYEIDSSGTTTERGTVAIDGNPATICTNGDGGNQLFITAGGNGYCYDLLSNTLTQVSALDGVATMGGYIDGFFLCFNKAEGKVLLSDIYDGTVWDPTQFFQRSSRSDTWQAMWVTSWNQIFLPGTKTRDYWYNSGAGIQPFVAAQSGSQPDGIAATFSMSENSGTLAWLQTNEDGGYQVMAATGYRGERISTHPVEDAIAGYPTSDINAATGETYTARGHRFYVLTFPANGTWVYDFTTQQWHRRSTLINGVKEAWAARFHVFAFNRHLWVDDETGVIWEADETFPLDINGRLIQRQRVAPSICMAHDRLSYGTLELVMQTGIGNTNDPGANPQIILELSNDGGRTFGPERPCGVGAQGEYWRRVKWERNGQSRDRATRLTATDPVYPWAIIEAYWDIELPSGQKLGRAA